MNRPNVYVTDHQHSKVVGTAFAQGCNGKIVPPNSLLDGPAVVYGILRGCDRIIRQCQWVERDFYHIDHGYFKRGHYDGYYRVTKNALQYTGSIKGFDSSRFNDLNLEIKPWRQNGRTVLVCPMTPAISSFYQIPIREWCDSVVRELSQITDRPIIVKEKDGEPITPLLKDAWCVVTYNSNLAVDAILAGIPAVVLGESASLDVSWGIEDIESPHWPERDEWAHALAWQQFTLDEMRSGFAWNCVA